MAKMNHITTDTWNISDNQQLLQERKSDLQRKFNDLPFDKKKEYLHVVFWTVRWTTWFFDTRFTADMQDYKNFDIGTWEFADVLIKKSWTYTEGWWWSESDNALVVIFKWKKYSWWWTRYFETKKIDRPDLHYQEIIDCTFDQSKDEFTLTVKCADNSTQHIVAKDGCKYNFEKELISKLRVPKELLSHQEDIKQILQEEISKEERELAIQHMYQKAVDIFILQGHRNEVQRYLHKPWVKLSEDQKKSYIEYLLHWRKPWGNGENMRQEDMKKLLVVLKTFDDKEYVKNICENMLEQSARRDEDEIFASIKKTIQLWWFDIQDWYTKKIDYYCKNSRYFKKMGETIVESGQDKKVRYKKYYDLHKPIDQSTLDIIAKATWENVKILFKESFVNYIHLLENAGHTNIEYFLKIMKQKKYEESLYETFFDKIAPNNYDKLRKHADSTEKVVNNIITIRSHTNKKINNDMLFELFKYTARKNRDKLWNIISQHLSPEEIQNTLTMIVDTYLHKDKMCCDLNLVINRWFEDTSKIVKLFDNIITQNDNNLWIDYCNSLISTLKNKKLLSKDNLLEQIHKVYKAKVDLFFQKKMIWDFIRYYPIHFNDKDFLEVVCDRYIVNTWDTFSHGDIIADSLVKIWFNQHRIQSFITKYSWNISILSHLIEWFGLHIDKVWVNTLIENLFDEWKVQEATKISRAWWLYDLWEKKIITWKLEHQKFDAWDASQAIEEWWLDTSYYKYVVDINITQWNLQEALQLAEKYDVVISQEQFDSYLLRNEKLRKDYEEKKLREHQTREKLATEMMKYLSEWKSSCDIDYTQDQKYVLLRNKQDWLKFASKNLEWHRDIVFDAQADKKDVVWWWRLAINEQQKVVRIYGQSWDFGKVASEFNEILKAIIKIKYPDYIIHIE